MAERKKREKSHNQIALEKAKETLEAAEKKLAAQNNETNKKTVHTAAEAVKDLAHKVARENFVRVGGLRANKAIAGIDKLVNISNRRSYNYTEDDANKIIDALKASVSNVENAFKTALSGGGGRASKNAISFE